MRGTGASLSNKSIDFFQKDGRSDWKKTNLWNSQNVKIRCGICGDKNLGNSRGFRRDTAKTYKNDFSSMGYGAAAVWRWSNCEDIPHIQRQRRSPSKTVGGVKSHLESNTISARETQRTQTNLVYTRNQRPHGLSQNYV